MSRVWTRQSAEVPPSLDCSYSMFSAVGLWLASDLPGKKLQAASYPQEINTLSQADKSSFP